ncbi:MAG: nitroreductase family protein [Bacteroidaceae bacterium]|nr:nitroreductase family protein [Bacteroidaceae bacterium]
MDFLEFVSSRQSDRAFDPSRPVEKEKLDRILECARLAPSACNSQPWKFIVVDDPDIKNNIADATANRILSINHFTKQAPVHIIIVEEQANISAGFGSWVKNKHFPHIDIGIAAAHICLAAHSEGLGSCILGWFNEKKIKDLLNIPSSKRPILDIVIGYSVQELRDKKRKKHEDVVTYNTYKK